MTAATMTGACWADPLSRAERRVLAGKLARATLESFHAAEGRTWAEMADLRIDVTERAEVAAS